MTATYTRFLLRQLDDRSECFRWLWRHHDAVAAFRKGRQGRVWVTLARTFMTEHKGVPVTRETMRQTWHRVEDEWTQAPDALRRAYDEVTADRASGVSERQTFPGRAVEADSELTLVSVKKGKPR